MDVLEGLEQLGLTAYEARAYAALVANPDGTGYDVARRSGVPRAKIYEVLGSLVAKDLAGTSEDGSRTRYHPLPPDVLLRRYLGRAEHLAGELAPLLTTLGRPESRPPLVTITGYERVLGRARDVIAAAARRLFVSGWPPHLAALTPALVAAEGRGVAVYVVVYPESDTDTPAASTAPAPGTPPAGRGPVTSALPLARVFLHGPTGPEAGRAAGVPWLVVAADHDEALVADPAPGDRAVALWTRQRVVATLAAEHIKHDIFVLEQHRLLAARGINLNRELAHLQEMWYDRLASSSAAAPTTGAPDRPAEPGTASPKRPTETVQTRETRRDSDG